jgi:ABC-type nitrate/sulfonate/bicarbonate transport system substrate-binding protein
MLLTSHSLTMLLSRPTTRLPRLLSPRIRIHQTQSQKRTIIGMSSNQPINPAAPAPPRGDTLRIAFVPEHFSTPLAFASKHFSLPGDLVPEPLGTGALASRLKAHAEEKQIDVAVGLTEAFVADLGKTKAAGYESGYSLVGTYVQSPLCWAISTGAERSDVKDVEGLRGKTVGVSRMGSGSFVMSQVLADQKEWLTPGQQPFKPEVIGDFKALREAVRGVGQKKADFFMWEHFTTKHYWDNAELKRLGEIYTPWPSWVVAARDSIPREQIEELLASITKGVEYYKEHEEEAVEYITSTMHYSKEDAKEWMKTVQFSDEVKGVETSMVEKTASLLVKAGVLKDGDEGVGFMVGFKR